MERPIDVHLFRPSTGERRVHQTECTWDDAGGNPDFIWKEGNFACDCNRSLFLYDWDDEKTLPCNTDANEIIIEKIVIRGTDTVVYSEPAP